MSSSVRRIGTACCAFIKRPTCDFNNFVVNAPNITIIHQSTGLLINTMATTAPDSSNDHRDGGSTGEEEKEVPMGTRRWT